MNSIQYLLAGGLGAIFLMAFCLLTLVSSLAGPIIYVNAATGKKVHTVKYYLFFLLAPYLFAVLAVGLFIVRLHSGPFHKGLETEVLFDNDYAHAHSSNNY